MLQIQRIGYLLVSLLLVSVLTAQDSQDVLVRALQDEMDRSLTELQLEDEPKPYFVSYAISDYDHLSETTVLGATVTDYSIRRRLLTVTVRVGDRTLDNSNFQTPGIQTLTGNLPITDNYDELRRVIWRYTDQAYKNAVEILSAKTTALESQSEEQRPPDFNDVEPHIWESDSSVTELNREQIKEIGRSVSALFNDHTFLHASSTSIEARSGTGLYLDSDGNFNRSSSSLCSLRSNVTLQTSSGRRIDDFNSAYAATCNELPSMNELKLDYDRFITHLKALQQAEELASYSGPILFEDSASAEILVQVLLTRIGARPKPVVPPNSNFNPPRNPYMDRIGKRIMARSLTLVNDPLLEAVDGKRLLGSYTIDSEGQPSSKVVIVEDGELKNLLTTRSPVEDRNTSSGSNRMLTGPLPGNLILSSNESSSIAELRDELLTLADDAGEDFGIVIRKMGSLDEGIAVLLLNEFNRLIPSLMAGEIVVRPTILAYKVFADGTEVPILPMEFDGFKDSDFRDIVAVSDESYAYNVPVTIYSLLSAMHFNINLQSTGVLVGVVTPALLLEEAELSSVQGNKPKLPILPHPLSDSSID